MFRAILYVQWKWVRFLLLAAAVGAAALPLVSARSDFTGGSGFLPLLSRLESFGLLYPFAAALIGGVVAAAIWFPDRQGRHVYGLSMPVARWHFVLLRYGAGCLLVLVPALALLIAAVLATVTTHLPPGLHAYPGQLALRFALATLVAFSVLFVLMTAERGVVAAILLGLFVLAVLVPVTAEWAGAEDPRWLVTRLLFDPPGPLAIFLGRWMLFDV